MPNDRFTEVTTQSWFGRIGNAFAGIIFGLILFVVSFVVLFWNEGRAVKQAKILHEGKGLVQPVPAFDVNPANNQKLVQLSGKAEANETLADPEFGIQEKALKLSRVVEAYQWQEKQQSHSQKNIGGSETTTTTYDYTTAWSKNLINSAYFKRPQGHDNPGSMLYSSRDYMANEIKVGAFSLSDGLKRKIGNAVALDVVSSTPLPQALQGKAKIIDGKFYFGNNPQSPQVGDLRIGFMVVRPCDVTIVAQQFSGALGPYFTKAGGNIEMLRMGTYSADDMFDMAGKDNKNLTWILRAVGFLLMFIGLSMLSKPLSTLADVLPFLGNIVGMGTGIIAFLFSAVLSLLTIALAWLAYRPLLGIFLIVAAGGIVYGLGQWKQQQKAQG